MGVEELLEMYQWSAVAALSTAWKTMTNRSKKRELLEQALALASESNLEEAISRLDEGLGVAAEEENRKWIAILARNAGLICDRSGDLAKAEGYYKKALEADTSDPYMHFALADLYKREGKLELANDHFQKCRDLAGESKDKDVLKMLEEAGFQSKS